MLTEVPAPLAAMGVFGGTFDPIHLGHLRLAHEAGEALQLAAVRFVPAGQPAHRTPTGASAEARLAMVERAIAGERGFVLDAAEVASAQPSYTVPTLQRLRAELGAARPLVLILGADAFAGLPGWYHWQELFALAHIAVATRPGYSLAADTLPPALAEVLAARQTDAVAALHNAAAGQILRFDMTPLAVSATAIREQIRTGRTPRFLVPPAVLDYIQTHSLYR